MKKALLISCLLLAAGASVADELSDAVKLFEKKDYAQAMQSYTKLANAGNVEAQQLLGEMYWYGDGMPADDAKAEFWFRKAAGAGNPKAKAILVLMQERVTRRADIAYYTTRFDGADVKYTCTPPAIPDISKSIPEIEQVGAGFGVWSQCHNSFVEKLNAALPPGKNIAPDVLKLMNDDELLKAQKLMDKTYAAIAADAQKTASQVIAQNTAWRDATISYVKKAPRSANGALLDQREIDLFVRQLESNRAQANEQIQGTKKK